MKLFYFLMLFSNTFYCTTIEQIKMIKHKKELKLSKLGKKIVEKHEDIELLAKKMISISRTESESFTPEQSEEYHKSIMSFVKRFKESKSINGLLLPELLKEAKYADHPTGYELNAVKFYLIHMINEYRLLKHLIKKYEKLSDERHDVNQQLIAADPQVK